jgi:hypothetical protein
MGTPKNNKKLIISFIINFIMDIIFVFIGSILIYKLLNWLFHPPIWVDLLFVGIFGGISARYPILIRPYEWFKKK